MCSTADSALFYATPSRVDGIEDLLVAESGELVLLFTIAIKVELLEMVLFVLLLLVPYQATVGDNSEKLVTFAGLRS